MEGRPPDHQMSEVARHQPSEVARHMSLTKLRLARMRKVGDERLSEEIYETGFVKKEWDARKQRCVEMMMNVKLLNMILIRKVMTKKFLSLLIFNVFFLLI
ncbi:hypothetical protein O6H91_06G145200 [Diphasiastrum complanatum]|uniref:Uncharacterized protein n=1 Tax=Diphasiastrum complanatum TaxID=34168 RepID=A0ACC2DKF6_DIPCM|nr:hypothetical protein O6H91_06G145200 [Diphasiastrum complanatum]